MVQRTRVRLEKAFFQPEARNNVPSLSRTRVSVTWARISSLNPDAIMGEVLNVIVAFAVIVFAVRWVTKGLLHLSIYLLLVLMSPF